MECVVHYAYSDISYNELKELSSSQYNRLVQAKKHRLKHSLANRHIQKSNNVPDNGLDVTRHGVQLEPCYKQFIAIFSSLNRKLSSSHPESTRAQRIKLDGPERLFPKACFFLQGRKERT